MRRISWMVVAAAAVFSIGCNMVDEHIKMMDTMRAAGATVMNRMKDGSMGQFQAAGQGINPGVTVEFGVKYFGRAYYDGLAGQFMVASQGELASGDQDEFWNVVNDKSLTDEQRSSRIWGIVERRLGTSRNPASHPAESR